MTTRFRAYLALAALGMAGPGARAEATEVALCTDLGRVTLELFDRDAPRHAENFLRYVETGSYSGSLFHRVVEGLVVQGGAYDRQWRRRETFEPVVNESTNGIANARGTIAAARADDPGSATAQFFVNVADNHELDGTGSEPGYSVFGRVAEGMEVIDAIASLPTGSAGPLTENVPDPVVAIRSAAVLDAAGLDEIPEPRDQHLRGRIAKASDNPHAVLQWVDQLRSLCADMDAATLLTEAQAAAALKRPFRARYALEEYFDIADPSDSGRAGAQALYADVSASSASGIEPLIAHCVVPNLPAIPDGLAADLDSMLAGQNAVKTFIADSEMYLDCLSETIDEDDLTDGEHANAVRQHNQMVRLMEELAEDFNREVRAFKSRE
jgi:cyclophilin family peptidyl-prolyl cis-trans isomerase